MKKVVYIIIFFFFIIGIASGFYLYKTFYEPNTLFDEKSVFVIKWLVRSRIKVLNGKSRMQKTVIVFTFN